MDMMKMGTMKPYAITQKLTKIQNTLTKRTVKQQATCGWKTMTTMEMKPYVTTQKHTRTQNTLPKKTVRQQVTCGWKAMTTMKSQMMVLEVT
jgi:hypothetical protein